MVNWVKNNKLTTVLLLIVGFFVFNYFIRFQELYGIGSSMMVNKSAVEPMYFDMAESAPAAGMGVAADTRIGFPEPEPTYDSVSTEEQRLVIQNSSMSLLVSDVRETGDAILSYVDSIGGFMVNSSYNRPEESAFGTITMRVPTDRLSEALDTFRSNAVKVTNETLQGTDVTEQYTDIEARLETLNKTKAKFEQILDQATEIQDILQVNQQLIYIQNQIDSLIGQRDALEKNASLTKITIYLSTDELSLPYSPDNKFRPGVVFKLAVRGLLTSLVWFAEKAIWIVVYSVIWIPALLVFVVVKKKFFNRPINKQ